MVNEVNLKFSDFRLFEFLFLVCVLRKKRTISQQPQKNVSHSEIYYKCYLRILVLWFKREIIRFFFEKEIFFRG